VSAIETVGDVSDQQRWCWPRSDRTSKFRRATHASKPAIAGILAGFHITSQNVGLDCDDVLMSRHVVTIGAIFRSFAGWSQLLSA
jgi:Leu/Phe-tRNA-protein transferase